MSAPPLQDGDSITLLRHGGRFGDLAIWTTVSQRSFLRNNSQTPLVCGDLDVEECLGTYDPNTDFYKNTEINNVWRSWFWMVYVSFLTTHMGAYCSLDAMKSDGFK